MDLVIKNIRLVQPGSSRPESVDLGIQDGKIALVEDNIPIEGAKSVYDGGGKLAFPGLVDAHMHTGIYAPLHEDALTESRAAAMGGVTSSLNYIRTGQYYLNRGGAYVDFMPAVHSLSKGNFYVDYAYHVAPIMRSHLDEIDMLIERHGVLSFKIFMFYGAHGLHGKAANQSEFLMTPPDEHYDIAHFEFVMRAIRRSMERFPELKDEISLSLHCETAEIMRAYTEIVEKDPSLKGLRAYSASRPPHSEGLAIFMAAYLANETDCVNINLLHLTSRKAVEAAMTMQAVFPHINFRREVTIGHLLLDVDTPAAWRAKVNPPIRPREDVEYLWRAVIDGDIDWICSDHACCKYEIKTDHRRPDDIFVAKSGFGGTEYLLSGLVTEGCKRGLSYGRIAELLCQNPAQRYGLRSKGELEPGFDADIVLFDPAERFVVRAAESPSAQGYTPFEGMELTGRVKQTFLRGQLIYDNGVVLGEPQGQYLRRPW